MRILLWAILMASQVIGSVIAGTIADPTGMAFQSHLVWAVNDAAWWIFYIGSGSTTTVQTFRSPDGVTWTAKTASGAFANTGNHNSQGRNLNVAYKNISANDVCHLDCTVKAGGATENADHSRAVMSAGAVTWAAWAEIATGAAQLAASFPSGIGGCLDSNNRPICSDNSLLAGGGNPDVYRGTNTDSGAAWTAGFGPGTNLEAVANDCNAQAYFDAGGGNLIALWENGGAAETTSMTNVRRGYYNGTNWTAVAIANVFTAFTAEDPNNFGAVARSTSDVHVVAKTGSNTYVHKRIDGSGTITSGDVIANQTSLAGGGIFLATDGSSVWMFVIDTDAPNTVRYSQWTSGSGWGAWTAFETTTKTRTFISGYPQAGNSTIGVIWTEANGANFDIVFEGLSVAAVAQPICHLMNLW